MLSILAIAFPLAGRAQSLHLDTQVIDSAQNSSVLIEANRLGISNVQQKGGVLPIVPSGADTSEFCNGSRKYHALMGVVVGTLGGAAIGATVGSIYDAHAGPDAMIPASAIFAAYGTVVGLVSGLVVGLAWPTK
jgi:hypothetical protein